MARRRAAIRHDPFDFVHFAISVLKDLFALIASGQCSFEPIIKHLARRVMRALKHLDQDQRVNSVSPAERGGDKEDRMYRALITLKDHLMALDPKRVRADDIKQLLNDCSILLNFAGHFGDAKTSITVHNVRNSLYNLKKHFHACSNI